MATKAKVLHSKQAPLEGPPRIPTWDELNAIFKGKGNGKGKDGGKGTSCGGKRIPYGGKGIPFGGKGISCGGKGTSFGGKGTSFGGSGTPCGGKSGGGGGKGAGFQGYCNFCGEYGHRLNQCHWKTLEMKKAKGGANYLEGDEIEGQGEECGLCDSERDWGGGSTSCVKKKGNSTAWKSLNRVSGRGSQR